MFFKVDLNCDEFMRYPWFNFIDRNQNVCLTSWINVVSLKIQTLGLGFDCCND